jgi:hypothetical protein
MKKNYKAEYVALKAELIPQITAPSIYPEDAALPDHPSLRRAVEELRKLEPEIVNMGTNKIFGDGGPYQFAQAIQHYYFSRNILNDPVVIWAGGVASKFIMQRRLREARPADRRRMVQSIKLRK